MSKLAPTSKLAIFRLAGDSIMGTQTLAIIRSSRTRPGKSQAADRLTLATSATAAMPVISQRRVALEFHLPGMFIGRCRIVSLITIQAVILSAAKNLLKQVRSVLGTPILGQG